MKIGAHVSIAGGVHTAFERATQLGSETIQIFASSPRAWKFREFKPDDVVKYQESSEETGIAPVFIHGSYLVNIGGAPDQLAKSVNCLVQNMEAAAEINAAGVVFHAGSHKGKGFDAVLGTAADTLRKVLDSSPEGPWLIVENSAGMGAHIRRLVRGAGSPDLRGRQRQDEGLPRHPNTASRQATTSPTRTASTPQWRSSIHTLASTGWSSFTPTTPRSSLGSGVDRHENIGEGHIGTAGFEVIMSNAAFQDVPFILEVPGPDKKGPDKDNVDRLKQIRGASRFW